MTDPNAHRPERGATGLILLLGGLTAIGPLSIDAYLPALPELARDLHASPAATQLTLSCFFLGLASAQLFWGPLADRVGRRLPLGIGLALFTLASAACALAPTIELLALGRFVQAVGGSVGIVVARAVVRDRWSGRAAAHVMSLLVLVMGAAPVLAPSLGSALLALAGWRAIFGLLVVFGALAWIAVRLALPETGAPRTPEPLARGIASVVRDPLFVTAALGGAFAQAGLFAYIAGSAFVFVSHHGLSPTAFAWIFGANALGLVLASQLNRRALRVAEPGAVARVATLVALCAGLALRLRADAGAWAEHAAWVFVYVAAYGLTSSNATALALENQRERAGLASAVLGSVQYGISALASVVVGLLSDGTPRAMATVMLGASVPALVLLSIAHARHRASLQAALATEPAPS